MKKFEIGKTYSMRSICDHDCVWTYTVTARTAKTITISDGEKVQKCRIIKAASEYRNAETELYGKFARAREGGAKIRTSKDFKAVIESYPELKSNVHTQKLLSQIETTENAKLNAKMTYTDAAAKYNAKIHSFPVALLRGICKWEDVNIEAGLSKEEMVSDGELGI